MSKHYISESLTAKFVEKLKHKIEINGSITKNDFNYLMQEILEEHNLILKS